jgi:hypothetical protein
MGDEDMKIAPETGPRDGHKDSSLLRLYTKPLGKSTHFRTQVFKSLEYLRSHCPETRQSALLISHKHNPLLRILPVYNRYNR